MEPHAVIQLDVPISIARASRLPSSRTLKVRKLRPSERASAMKSRAQVFVQARRCHQRLAEAGRHPPFRPPRQIEPQGAVHTVHTLVVPPMPGPAQATEVLPEAPPTVSPDHVIQRGDDVAVPLEPSARRRVVRRPRQFHRLAGPPHRHVVLVHQHRQGFAFRGRCHRFRLKTSLMAALRREGTLSW
jgi:hypothetical protein